MNDQTKDKLNYYFNVFSRAIIYVPLVLSPFILWGMSILSQNKRFKEERKKEKIEIIHEAPATIESSLFEPY